MRCSKLFLCAVSMAVAFLHTQGADAATLRLSPDMATAVIQEQGHSRTLSPADFPVQRSRDSPFIFVPVAEEASGELGVSAGVYLFHKDGSPAGIIHTPDAAFCNDVYLSPDRKYLLMGAGMMQTADLFVYS